MQNMRAAPPFKLKLETIDEVSYNDIFQQQKQLEDLQEKAARDQQLRTDVNSVNIAKEKVDDQQGQKPRSSVIKVAPPATPTTATSVNYVPVMVTPNSSSKRSRSKPRPMSGEAGVQRPSYQCDTCYKLFAQRHYLVIHQRTHTGEKPFECRICMQRFARRDTLRIHYRTHTGEKPFHCDLCTKQFAQRDKLQIHRRVHTGEKPYSCHVCEKRFSQRNTLLVHLRCHSGEKPFVCEVCLRQFSVRDKLHKHSLTHTHEKPFPCNVCLLRFARRDALERHRKMHAQQAMTPSEAASEHATPKECANIKKDNLKTNSSLSKEVTDFSNVNKYMMFL